MEALGRQSASNSACRQGECAAWEAGQAAAKHNRRAQQGAAGLAAPAAPAHLFQPQRSVEPSCESWKNRILWGLRCNSREVEQSKPAQRRCTRSAQQLEKADLAGAVPQNASEQKQGRA